MSSHSVSILQFADDAILLSLTCIRLRRLLTALTPYCNQEQLSINYSKTKVMIFSKSLKHTFLKSEVSFPVCSPIKCANVQKPHNSFPERMAAYSIYVFYYSIFWFSRKTANKVLDGWMDDKLITKHIPLGERKNKLVFLALSNKSFSTNIISVILDYSWQAAKTQDWNWRVK